MSPISSRHPFQLDAATRDAALDAARREGKTLSQWLDETIRSKALRKTDHNNPELGNSLEQRLSEITRRLTLNTQAKLSATKMTSTDMPPAWQGQRRINSFSKPYRSTSKQEENLHHTLRKLHRELDRTRQAPTEHDQDRARKRQKLALLLTTVNALQDQLLKTTQRPDPREIPHVDKDHGKTEDSITSPHQQVFPNRLSSKQIAKLREEDLSPILKNLSQKLAAIESRLERIAAPEKHQILAFKEANIQLDTICDQDRLEIRSAGGWEKLESKLAELAQKIILSSNLKYQLENNEAMSSFNILNKEISCLDKKISQSLSDNAINNAATKALFDEISQKIDQVIGRIEILANQNNDNSILNDILQGNFEIKSEVLQNKKTAELAENQLTALIKLIGDLNEKLDIGQKDKNTTISLENLKKEIDSLAQEIQTQESNGKDRNILDAQFAELKDHIKTTQMDASHAVQEGFKLIQATLSGLHQKQTSLLGAASDPPHKSIMGIEPVADLMSLEKSACTKAEDFTPKSSSSIQKEFIAAARRSADQERSIDLSTPTTTQEPLAKTLSLFKVLEERKKSLLLCVGLLGALIASEPFHENAKLYFKNLKFSAKTNLAPLSTYSNGYSEGLTKKLYDKKEHVLIKLSEEQLTQFNRLIDPNPICTVLEISALNSELQTAPNKPFSPGNNEAIIIDRRFLTHETIEKDPKTLNI